MDFGLSRSNLFFQARFSFGVFFGGPHSRLSCILIGFQVRFASLFFFEASLFAQEFYRAAITFSSVSFLFCSLLPLRIFRRGKFVFLIEGTGKLLFHGWLFLERPLFSPMFSWNRRHLFQPPWPLSSVLSPILRLLDLLKLFFLSLSVFRTRCEFSCYPPGCIASPFFFRGRVDPPSSHS